MIKRELPLNTLFFVYLIGCNSAYHLLPTGQRINNNKKKERDVK